MTAPDKTEVQALKTSVNEDPMDEVNRQELLRGNISRVAGNGANLMVMPSFEGNIFGSVFDSSPPRDGRLASITGVPQDVSDVFSEFSRASHVRASERSIDIRIAREDLTKNWALGTENPALVQSRKEVLNLAAANGIDKNVFAGQMRALEDRVKAKETTASEVKSTYDNVARLLRNDGNSQLSKGDMNRLATQVMKHASDPSMVFQGAYNTCTVAALEVRTYTRNPGAAAKLVADVAEKGFFRSSFDGTRVDVDRKPHGESLLAEKDNTRTHASEIFQVAAANLHWTDKGKQYSQITPGADGGYSSVRRKNNTEDNGERLVDKKTGRPVENGELHYPAIPDGSYDKIASRITGRKETQVLMSHADQLNESAPNVMQPKSARQMETMLSQLRKEGKFPILVSIDANNEPFKTDGTSLTQSGSPGVAADDDGAHMITVKKYIPGEKGLPGRILIDNTWDKATDRLNPKISSRADKQGKVAAGAPLTVEQLYRAMQNASSK